MEGQRYFAKRIYSFKLVVFFHRIEQSFFIAQKVVRLKMIVHLEFIWILNIPYTFFLEHSAYSFQQTRIKTFFFTLAIFPHILIPNYQIVFSHDPPLFVLIITFKVLSGCLWLLIIQLISPSLAKLAYISELFFEYIADFELGPYKISIIINLVDHLPPTSTVHYSLYYRWIVSKTYVELKWLILWVSLCYVKAVCKVKFEEIVSIELKFVFKNGLRSLS